MDLPRLGGRLTSLGDLGVEVKAESEEVQCLVAGNRLPAVGNGYGLIPQLGSGSRFSFYGDLAVNHSSDDCRAITKMRQSDAAVTDVDGLRGRLGSAGRRGTDWRRTRGCRRQGESGGSRRPDRLGGLFEQMAVFEELHRLLS